MSNKDASPRIVASKRVMRALAITAIDAPLLRDANGEAQIIVALPSEYASEVLARVRAIGSEVNVIIAYAKSFELLTMSASGSASRVLEINKDLSMGMLALRIKENPGMRVRLNIRNESVVDIPSSSLEFQYA